MIKEILSLSSKGNLSFSEISRELKISQDELKHQMEMMERMGYLEAICEPPSSTEDKCRFCSMGGSCSGGGANHPSGKTYRLTEKGKRVCSK